MFNFFKNLKKKYFVEVNRTVHPMSNRIRKFLNLALSCLLFMHPCRIGEWWLFNFLACLGGLIISCSKLDSDILFTYLSCICIISFCFSIPYEFLCSHFNARLHISSFPLVSSRPIFSTWYRLFSSQSESKISGASLLALTFVFHLIESHSWHYW